MCSWRIPRVPASNLSELIALAMSKPETLTFGSSGAGTASHMAAELFNEKAGTSVVIVPYQAEAIRPSAICSPGASR